mmetsp:Transcript_27811/g.39188  ORF Transcript_27811/g.39188 Transcript_27811/m.39188 type:complete len:382 (+) Transcript_27811:72-1217(+)
MPEAQEVGVGGVSVAPTAEPLEIDSPKVIQKAKKKPKPKKKTPLPDPRLPATHDFDFEEWNRPAYEELNEKYTNLWVMKKIGTLIRTPHTVTIEVNGKRYFPVSHLTHCMNASLRDNIQMKHIWHHLGHWTREWAKFNKSPFVWFDGTQEIASIPPGSTYPKYLGLTPSGDLLYDSISSTMPLLSPKSKRVKQTEYEYQYVTHHNDGEEYYNTNLTHSEYHTNADMNNQAIAIDFQNASTTTYNNIQASEHDAINVISNFSNEMIHSNNNNPAHSNVMSIQHISNNQNGAPQGQGFPVKRKREEVSINGILGLKNHMEKRLMLLESEIRGIRAELNQFTSMLLQLTQPKQEPSAVVSTNAQPVEATAVAFSQSDTPALSQQ